MAKQTQLFELQSENSTQKLTFYSSLEKLNRACLKCDRCPLSQKRQQVVTARLEQRTDMYVSHLRQIIEAMGGQLDIVARFPDGEVKITNFNFTNSSSSNSASN